MLCLKLQQRCLIMLIEVGYTYGVDTGVWVDLECVDVVPGVLEEPVVRVQHLVGQQAEPLPEITQQYVRTSTKTAHLVTQQQYFKKISVRENDRKIPFVLLLYNM